MADFGFLSDTDDSAVEELISQVQELSVLEQVAAINCSGFTDSVLPTELESRFRRLKSFPITKQNPKASSSKSLCHSKRELTNSWKREEESGSLPDEENEIFSDIKRNPDGKMGFNSHSEYDLLNNSVKCKTEYGSSSDESQNFSGFKQNSDGELRFKKKSPSGYALNSKKNSSGKGGAEYDNEESENLSDFNEQPDGKMGLNSSNSSMGNEIFSPLKENPDEKKVSREKPKLKSKSGSFSSRFSSSDSWIDSTSPPQKAGCFWCSRKMSSKRKSKENRVLGTGFDCDMNDDFLSDLSTFSVKEQQKILRKVMKEQQKISREAEKIVKWAKQSSARMSAHGIENELSDDESTR